ncbi:MAG: hypothetical protein M1826_005174 [Phylliscum demangeonii]|nr:MAG: hypothetical protein M1826_005174 [Phylliscum demangeonii]
MAAPPAPPNHAASSTTTITAHTSASTTATTGTTTTTITGATMTAATQPTSNSRSRSSTSASATATAASTAANPEKARLSEQEKKSNHIASEQKRRQAIRDGFDRLTELVPGLEGQARSESVVLKKSVDFMRRTVQERARLVREIQRRGGTLPEKM